MMEGSSEIIETSGFKRLKSSEGEQDRISSLPDSVLVHILSFLPTVDAVRTVLFPKIGRLWTFIHSLDFDECPYHVCRDDSDGEVADWNDCYGPSLDKRFLNFIRHVLVLHQRPTIYKFRLRFLFFLYHSTQERMLADPEPQKRKERKVANEIDMWIRFAIMREVKVLDLDFVACGDSSFDAAYKLPDFVFSSDLLTEMKLAYCDVKPCGQIHMGSLKILSLTEIRLSNKKLNEILHGCPLLEDLFLIECYGLRKLNFTASNIKNLTLVFGIEETSKLKISCPNLMSFSISKYIERAYLMNLSSLVNATIDYFSHGFSNECSEFKALIEKLLHSKVITLCDHSVLVFTLWVVKNLPCPSSNWKSVVLRTKLTKWHIQGISGLLSNSPSLEALTIYMEPYSSDSCIVDEMGLGSYDFNGESYWSAQAFTFHCLAHHLKSITINSFTAEPYAIQLVEFLLKSALFLEKMAISFQRNVKPHQHNHFTSEKFLEFSLKLLSFPRGSPRAVVLLS